MAFIQHISPEDRQRNASIYDSYHRIYHMEDGWLPGNKERNYEYMVRLPGYINQTFEDTACLDVGCGSGDFSKWLRERGVSKYVGIDIYNPSLQKARKKYPYEDFRLIDILSEPLEELFDYAFCSGSLSTKLTVNNYDFFASMIKVIWSKVRRGLVFNVLSDSEPAKAPYIFYYSSEKIGRICAEIAGAPAIIIKHDLYGRQIHGYVYKNSERL